MPKSPIDESLDVDGAHTLAGAFCLLAAVEFSDSVEHHEQLAAHYYTLASTGFAGVPENKVVAQFVKDMIDKAKKAK